MASYIGMGAGLLRRENNRILAIAFVAMVSIVVISNILVQIPFGDYLTWGAFSYPFAFLVTDLVNRRAGPRAARKVASIGFAFAVVLSFYLAAPRIAIASGTAFLAAQLLDIFIFDKLRNYGWWPAPLISSVIGSFLDTLIFFTLAFSASFAFLGVVDQFSQDPILLMGQFEPISPRWYSWGIGDYAVKVICALAALMPFRILMGRNLTPIAGK